MAFGFLAIEDLLSPIAREIISPSWLGEPISSSVTSRASWDRGLRSLRTRRPPYRLDSRHCTGSGKDSGEQEIVHFQRETTDKSGEPRKHDQLLQAWFHPRLLRLHLALLTTTRVVVMSGPHLLAFSLTARHRRARAIRFQKAGRKLHPSPRPCDNLARSMARGAV